MLPLLSWTDSLFSPYGPPGLLWAGPLWARPLWAPWALMGRDLMGRALVGPLWAGPLWAGPLGLRWANLLFVSPGPWSKAINVSSTYTYTCGEEIS